MVLWCRVTYALATIVLLITSLQYSEGYSFLFRVGQGLGWGLGLWLGLYLALAFVTWANIMQSPRHDIYEIQSTECLKKKLTLLNSLPNKNFETFSGNFHMYGWLEVSSIIWHQKIWKLGCARIGCPFCWARSSELLQRKNWWWSGEFMINYDGYGLVPCMTCSTSCPRPTQPHSSPPLSHNMYHHLTNNTQQHRYHYQYHSR